MKQFIITLASVLSMIFIDGYSFTSPALVQITSNPKCMRTFVPMQVYFSCALNLYTYAQNLNFNTFAACHLDVPIRKNMIPWPGGTRLPEHQLLPAGLQPRFPLKKNSDRELMFLISFPNDDTLT